jgi:flagellar hook-associated protein 1 FlgK
VRVDDADALPLSNTATVDPNDTVIGIDFSGGIASVAAQLNSALGTTGLQFSNPSGTTLRVLDDGATNKVDVDALSAIVTATSLTGGRAEFPFFTDGSLSYTGAITASGSQAIGLAGRISVNDVLRNDPSRLVVYETSPLTPAGDASRPIFIYDKLTNASLRFSPQSGIGVTNSPFTGSLPAFMRQVISQQGAAAEAAANLKAGQDVVFNALQQRFNENAGVNIDQEMASLLSLQNAYAANARVLTTIRDMLEILMQL